MNRSFLLKSSLFFMVVAIAGLLLCASSYAQTEKSSAEEINEAFQKSEAAKKLKQEVSLLKELFGIETKKEEKSSSNTNSSGRKTIADVADNALQLTKGLVVSISETLQKVAPNVWRIMIKQQYVKAVSGVLVPWGIFFVFFVYIKVIQKRWIVEDKKSEEYQWRIAFATIIPIIVCVGSGIVGVCHIANAFKYLINPEFYALRDLLVVLLGSGS